MKAVHQSRTSDRATTDTAATQPSSPKLEAPAEVGSESFDAQPDLKHVLPKARKATGAQKNVIEIMVRQLGLRDHDLAALLGMQCNRRALEDLDYRSAAGFIAYLGRQLREKRNKK